ncbi:YwqG family protein [Solibacillus sp. CAU 1738]|uniref:YwqG family protein n=1 Tax=Solibacillus sp. CAU 1738 TaxID=3140363 RepID=UPI0032616357
MTQLKRLNIPKILEPFRVQLEKSAIDYAEIIVRNEQPAITASKFAGNPYLPQAKKHPKDTNGQYMPLLAQINFSEFSLPSPFPQQGLLQFFISVNAYQFTPLTNTFNRQSDFKVRYYKTTDEASIIDFSYAVNNKVPFPITKEYALYFVEGIEPVSATDYRLTKFIPNANSYISEDGQSFEDIYLSTFLGADHKIGGYPYFIEEDIRQLNPHLKSYDTLLLQIISNDEEGIMWGNSGIVSFLINSERLKQLDFTDIYFYSDQY